MYSHLGCHSYVPVDRFVRCRSSPRIRLIVSAGSCS